MCEQQQTIINMIHSCMSEPVATCRLLAMLSARQPALQLSLKPPAPDERPSRQGQADAPGLAPPTRSTPETLGTCAASSVAMTSASPAGLHTPPTHTCALCGSHLATARMLGAQHLQRRVVAGSLAQALRRHFVSVAIAVRLHDAAAGGDTVIKQTLSAAWSINLQAGPG